MATTPSERQFSLPRFFYQQITYKPIAVKDADLSGKTAIVTGSNTGVGLEVSRQLLDLGLSRLILAVRDQEKGRAAAAKLSPGDPSRIEVWHLDLCDYDSVVAFGKRAKSLSRLDIAILNAGICPAKRTFNVKTGHDEIIQVNYLSTALLAILLLPVAKAARASQSAPTRITFTSSEFSALAKFKFSRETPILAALDRQEGPAETVNRMFVSKLLGQFFLRELSSRVPAGSVAVINAASPGAIHNSEFNRDLAGTFAGTVNKTALKAIGNSSAVGARMMTDAAVNHGEETHGRFWSFQKPAAMAPLIYTEEGNRISAQLWKETLEELSFANVEDILRDISS